MGPLRTLRGLQVTTVSIIFPLTRLKREKLQTLLDKWPPSNDALTVNWKCLRACEDLDELNDVCLTATFCRELG